MKTTMLFILLLISGSLIWGQETAITSSGNIVILNEDGTWKLLKNEIDKSISFRKSTWGCSKEIVKAQEDKEIIYEDDDAIIYKGSISNLECSIIFIFTSEKLIRGRYYFDENHSNTNSYIDDYQLIKKLLIEKYGNPKEDEQIWKNDLYKDDYTGWGMAISLGHMYYYAKWETDQTEIFIQLYGDNYKIKHVIDYTSKALGALEDEISNAKAKEEL